ncbi:hypothetical protein [Mucilaginibacter segetis]|uniref:Uncharacterized protein n=1 Tax=Mucilaginibacter segetis TaxID=2793071 RepID=A0A934UP08_9SPHI|nr:hypothetical protein [Mucilaginibacter segetis]MBK0380650.1 hypothetical protein [Mucilaginibacter segetis]
MFSKIKAFLRGKSYAIDQVHEVRRDLKELFGNDLKSPKVNLGQIQAYLNNQRTAINSITDVEFQVFSQFGDDGIIQYLVNKLDIPNKVFIEFGVENYKESNTRFLLINNKWSGLVIDGGKQNIDYIKRDAVSWANNLHAVHAFITTENINQIIGGFLAKGYPSEIGILSVDIDGNDYFVWKEINTVNPIIVIAEYNAVFGAEKAWTIPYQEDFYRLDADPTSQYWGASLKCLCILAEEKGYYFIGCNSNGNNAYFIRKDKIADLKPLSCAEGFMQATYREYIDENWDRLYGEERLELIRGKKMLNIETNQIEII